MDGKAKLSKFLDTTKDLKVVVLTGAGISAESGLQTFRDINGLWENHKIEQVATLEGFINNPQLVYRFYNERRQKLLQVKPNQAHHELAQLEKLLGMDFFLITQNVDDLHDRALSKNIVHMHGELLKARCVSCETIVPCIGYLDLSNKCNICSNQMRPHIVWFNETPLGLNQIEKKVKACNLFISIGTSGTVYPAAALYSLAKMRGAFTVEINLKSTCRNFDCSLEGPATTLLKQLVDEIESKYVSRLKNLF